MRVRTCAVEAVVMLKLWVALFILGNLFGRALSSWELIYWMDHPAARRLCVGLALVLSRVWQVSWLRSWCGIFLGIFAFIWGFAHAGPALSLSLPEAQIVMVSVDDGSPGPVLLRSGGLVFESYGRRVQGAVGRGVLVAPDAPRLFSRLSSHFSLVSGQISELGPALALAAKGRETLREVRKWREAVPRGWLGAILLGDKRDLSPAIKAAFKLIGVYHLLIVSGLHVTLMVSIWSLLFRIPLHVAYAIRLIPNSAWPEVTALARIVAAVVSLIYLVMAGMPVPAQRATFLFVWYQCGCVFIGAMPLTTRMLLGAALQTLIFPIGFVSEATLVTWGAYLLVVHVGHAEWRRGFVRGLRLTLGLQLRLMLLVFGVFGQLSFIGLVANLCLVPLLGLLLATGLLVVFLPGLPGRALLLAFHATFSECVRHVAALTVRFPWLAPEAAALPEWLRPLALLISAMLLLNACRDLSIRRYDLQ